MLAKRNVQGEQKQLDFLRPVAGTSLIFPLLFAEISAVITPSIQVHLTPKPQQTTDYQPLITNNY